MKLIFFVATALLSTACASLSPVGKWDFQITGTPQGDYGGVMTVMKKDKKTLGAEMKLEVGSLPFNQFLFDAKTKKSMGNFDYQSMSIGFEATVNEKEMNGKISVEGMNFPFKATRKIEAKK